MSNVKLQVFGEVLRLVEDKSVQINDDTPLIGDGSVLDSMRLVQLCLALEDLAETLGFDFDWRSDTAMSKSRSKFRTAGSLAEDFRSQMGPEN